MCLLKVLVEILSISNLYNNYYSIFKMLGRVYLLQAEAQPTTLLPQHQLRTSLGYILTSFLSLETSFVYLHCVVFEQVLSK